MEVPPCPMKTSLFSLEMVENYHFLEAHAGAQKMVKGSLVFSPAHPAFLITQILKGDLNIHTSMAPCPSSGHGHLSLPWDPGTQL